MTSKIRKAIFPVAGFGTRFLPATKATPKEMLPVVNKPLIQYAVEEAAASGIEEMIFVTSHTKRAIEDHFDSNCELENMLREKNNQALLEVVQNVLPNKTFCVYVRQPEMLGLGHAVLCAKEIVGDEPFAVLLADDLVDSQIPCLKQLVDVFMVHQSSVMAVQSVADNDVKKYGIVDLAEDLSPQAKIKSIVEKPAIGQAPSNFGVIGRYILTPQIFTLLENTTPGAGSEIQLTDAIASLLQTESVYALQFEGARYDCGSKLGYLEATVAYALKHDDVAGDFRSFLENIVARME